MLGALNIRYWKNRIGWLEISFLVLLALSLGLRLWELGGRTMHYDEAIHVHYAWRLSNLEEYIHSPWMHGPFQIEYVALIFGIFGDSDFTSRVGYVLFGVALVGLPYFLRQYLGARGALFTGIMLALSPVLLYFSRFGRNDIIMVFWATALLVLMWRYIHEDKNRYLYLASAILAFMFATKETAYFIALIFGALAFLLALPQLTPVLFRREKLAGMAGPAAFFLLIVTLTLPQWSAVVGIFQGLLGLTLVNPNGVTAGLVGAPHWAGASLILPLYSPPVWVHAFPAVLLVAALLWLGRRGGWSSPAILARIVVPLCATGATLLAIFRPVGPILSPGNPSLLVDLPLAAALAFTAVGLLWILRHAFKPGLALVLVPVLLTALYSVLFTPVLNIDALVHSLLPSGIQVDTSQNSIPLNYIVAGVILLATLGISAVLGLAWHEGVWARCAIIFYTVWLTLYTTVFTNWAGAFSGVWQGMGYWIAQQEVARGNQPWYYYFVGLSVYEILPILFGVLGTVYFFKKGDVFGLALAFWAGLSLLAYTTASEKMPWLLVNITVPFILLAGKYLGELTERVRWREALSRGTALLLVLIPLGVVGGVYLLRSFINIDVSPTIVQWLVLAGVAILAVECALLIRLSHAQSGMAMTGLGIAALLLAFGTWSAVRASYTFDDSYPEILVYAQGSVDLRKTYQELQQSSLPASSDDAAVRVDYDLWYPFQWYVRDETRQGELKFACFKDEREDGYNTGCQSPTAAFPSTALLVTAQHTRDDESLREGYQKSEARRNLLWFPESYRRPGENRQEEGPLEELSQDLVFFKDSATSRLAWQGVIDYILFRELQRDWYNSEYYTYVRK